VTGIGDERVAVDATGVGGFVLPGDCSTAVLPFWLCTGVTPNKGGVDGGIFGRLMTIVVFGTELAGGLLLITGEEEEGDGDDFGEDGATLIGRL